jgi:molecular chaperone GrpE
MMTDQEKMPEPANDASSQTDASAQPAETAGEDAQPHPAVVIEKLNAENVELKDRVLRTLAEMENLRRRTEKEVADAKAYGVTNIARDMTAFADNLRRAIESVPAEVRESEANLRTLVEGLELTERDFLSRLSRHGVKKLEPQGQKFDPNMHEALFEIPDPSVPSGTVMQVVEAGYSIGERCLRPAKVGVARGGPKAANGEENGAPTA